MNNYENNIYKLVKKLKKIIIIIIGFLVFLYLVGNNVNIEGFKVNFYLIFN